MPLEFNPIFNMEVKQDTRNELFKRQELVLELESNKNPSFDEIRKKISEDLSKEENLVDVYNIYGGFGKKKFKINANVYDSKEDLDNVKKLEVTSKARKEGVKEEEVQGEGGEKVEEEDKPAEEASEEQLVEEEKPIEPAEDTKTEEMKEEPIEEPEKKPEEAPTEDKPDDENKAIKEEREMKEEAKE